MYNRYIPNGASYTRIMEEDAPSPRPAQTAEKKDVPPPEPPENAPKDDAPEHASGLSALLKKLKLEDLDTGDALLLLILLFLFLEGDDLELIITLGLLLVMGLGRK